MFLQPKCIIQKRFFFSTEYDLLCFILHLNCTSKTHTWVNLNLATGHIDRTDTLLNVTKCSVTSSMCFTISAQLISINRKSCIYTTDTYWFRTYIYSHKRTFRNSAFQNFLFLLFPVFRIDSYVAAIHSLPLSSSVYSYYFFIPFLSLFLSFIFYSFAP